MKPLTEQQLKDHAAASRRGAIEGVLASGSVALAGAFYANKHWPAYRRLPISLKALGTTIIVAPVLSIQAERRGLEYDRSQWVGEGVRMLDEKEQKVEARWAGLSTGDKIGDWAYRHQYSIILGSWAASLGLAGAIISRNKYQTYAQKIVQARMWAQGLTIGILIVAGALSQSKKAKAATENVDHSWKELIDHQEQEKREAEQNKNILPTPAGREAFSARYGS